MHKNLIQSICTQNGIQLLGFSSVHGGDISDAYLIESSVKSYFIKVNPASFAEHMFKIEAKGLQLISYSNTIATPEVIATGKVNEVAYLLLENIPTGPKTETAMTKLGRQLATMHQYSHGSFGLDHDNYIGKLPQDNTPHNNWIAFYAEERLLVQLRMAVDKSLIRASEVPSYEKIESSLGKIMPEVEPVLLHGDLWGGNYLISEAGKPYLIDPAVYYGHCEVDIAMSQLFGGFSNAFYNAYFDILPKENHFEERMDIYQLYYLLVHLNLFGSSYYGSVKRIMERYF